MINDVLRDTEGKMKKSVEALRQHLTTIRTGRASPALVEHLQVEAWGSAMPLNQLAGITTPDARMIVIQPYDKSTIKAIEKAIQNSELGINPSNDGVVIRLSIPPLTEDRRRALTKQVKSQVEESKVAVRNQRRDALDAVKKLEHDKQISENDQRRGQEKLQELTDKYIREVEQIGAAKEAEVMEV
ncbi:ribosome recycling factor [Kouleothrix aurantiaca]|jgi:ribosome recycling factor|uniref:Ribosome-recycling factor n=1 Tax=Kouleothrix aurantiaca TaxID=186479 RepID=A0A0P9FAH8_9CHLR|nr:ribosome recycling factor [Kouleothrix aurantiaca]